MYGEGGSFGRCKVRISPRQCFVCVEAVLGEVSEWIVGDFHEKAGRCQAIFWSWQPYIRLPTNGRHI